jgi:hypothetical protein
MRINGKKLVELQRQQFIEALHGAFNQDSLDDLIRSIPRRNIKLEDIIVTRGLGFRTILGKVIDRAEEESWTADLLQEALKARPDDEELQAFASNAPPPASIPPIDTSLIDTSHFLAMERTIRKANPTYDIDLLAQDLRLFSNCVCHIENSSGEHLGTGFLVGPKTIMTSYHVWTAARSSEDFICRFDYKGIPNSKEVNQGITCGLSKNAWEIYESKHHPDEFSEKGSNILPEMEQLDFILLQLEKPIGNQNIQDNQGNATTRGWLKFPLQEQDYTFSQNDPLFIIHHPTPSPDMPYFPERVMKISLETDAIIDCNQNKTRVRYKTNTQYGSSGAPCFNAHWELVAIHQSGDLDYKNNHKPQYNQGIPMSAIMRLLEKDGIMKLLLSPDAAEEYVSTSNQGVEKAQATSHSSHKNQMKNASESASPARSDPPRSVTRVNKEQTRESARENSSSTPNNKAQKNLKRTVQKPVDLNTYRKKREATKLSRQELPSNQIRQHFEEAQRDIHNAQMLFAGTYTSGDFQQAIKFLQAAEKSLQSIPELLKETQSIPETVLKNSGMIRQHISTISEQIERSLVPELNWNKQVDFSVVYEVLKRLDELIPDSFNH